MEDLKMTKGHKGSGSFWISCEAITRLIQQKASAMQISAYLVLAKHTEKTGRLSTAGFQAVRTALGVGYQSAENALLALVKMELAMPADRWRLISGEILPERPSALSQIRWVLDLNAGTPGSRVWISNSLIEGYGKFTKPLKKLKMCGDVAARLLLLAYQQSDLEQFGGVKPSAFYVSYKMCKIMSLKGYDLWHGLFDNKHSFRDFMASVLDKPIPKSEKDVAEALKPFWEALDALDSAGFIYQVVTVLDRAANNQDAQAIYDLDTKSRHGYKPDGERGLAGETARISGALGNPVSDSMGRFYERYAAIVPAGVTPNIVGIYRIRFRVANPKNYGVTLAWSRIRQSERDAIDWLQDLCQKHGLPPMAKVFQSP